MPFVEEISEEILVHNNDGTRASFAKFLDDFAKFFDVFGTVRTCFYAFGYIRIHSDAFGKKKFVEKKIEKKKSENFATFFDVFGRFWGSWRQTDLKISSGIKFCSRYTYPEVRATQNREKMIRTRPLRAP